MKQGKIKNQWLQYGGGIFLLINWGSWLCLRSFDSSVSPSVFAGSLLIAGMGLAMLLHSRVPRMDLVFGGMCALGFVRTLLDLLENLPLYWEIAGFGRNGYYFIITSNLFYQLFITALFFSGAACGLAKKGGGLGFFLSLPFLAHDLLVMYHSVLKLLISRENISYFLEIANHMTLACGLFLCFAFFRQRQAGAAQISAAADNQSESPCRGQKLLAAAAVTGTALSCLILLFTILAMLSSSAVESPNTMPFFQTLFWIAMEYQSAGFLSFLFRKSPAKARFCVLLGLAALGASLANSFLFLFAARLSAPGAVIALPGLVVSVLLLLGGMKNMVGGAATV